MKAGHAVEDIRRGGVDGSRGEPRPRQLRHGGDVEPVLRPVLEDPEHGRQLRAGRLQHGREVDVERAEAHAVLAQLGPRRLIERADLLRHALAPQHTEVLLEAEGDAACEPGDVLSGVDLHQRLQPLADELGHPGAEPLAHLLLVRAGEVLVGDDHDCRPERVIPRFQPRDLHVPPQDLAATTRRTRIASSLAST